MNAFGDTTAGVDEADTGDTESFSTAMGKVPIDEVWELPRTLGNGSLRRGIEVFTAFVSSKGDVDADGFRSMEDCVGDVAGSGGGTAGGFGGGDVGKGGATRFSGTGIGVLIFVAAALMFDPAASAETAGTGTDLAGGSLISVVLSGAGAGTPDR